MGSLAWDSTEFFIDGNAAAQPSSEVLQIATLAAMSMAVIPPAPPAANSSFHLQFDGPTLQCDTANSSQQPNFDYYTQVLANGRLLIATRGLHETNKLRWRQYGPMNIGAPVMHVYSAFSPYASQLGWFASPNQKVQYITDLYNNWVANIPYAYLEGAIEDADPITQQLWIQTSNKALVCIMGNATFDVDFEFVDTALTVAGYSISLFEPFFMPLHGTGMKRDRSPTKPTRPTTPIIQSSHIW